MDKEELRHGGIPDIDERVWAVYGDEEKTKAGRTRAKSLADLKALSQKAVAEERKPKRNMKKAVEKMAADLGIGVLTLSDIIGEMKKPGRDPREDAPPVVFRNDVRSFDDLEVGMELEGTVRNVVDFGAFCRHRCQERRPRPYFPVEQQIRQTSDGCGVCGRYSESEDHNYRQR